MKVTIKLGESQINLQLEDQIKYQQLLALIKEHYPQLSNFQIVYINQLKQIHLVNQQTDLQLICSLQKQTPIILQLKHKQIQSFRQKKQTQADQPMQQSPQEEEYQERNGKNSSDEQKYREDQKQQKQQIEDQNNTKKANKKLNKQKKKKNSKVNKIGRLMSKKLQHIIQLKIKQMIPQLSVEIIKIINSANFKQQDCQKQSTSNKQLIVQSLNQYTDLSKRFTKEIIMSLNKPKTQSLSNTKEKIKQKKYDQNDQKDQKDYIQQKEQNQQRGQHEQKDQKKQNEQNEEKGYNEENEQKDETNDKDQKGLKTVKEQKIKKRCQKLSKIYGNKAEYYSQFVKDNINLTFSELKELFMEQNSIWINNTEEQKIQTKMGKLSQFFGTNRQKYRQIVTNNKKLNFDELLRLLKSKGIQDYEDEKYTLMRVKRMRQRKIKISQPVIQQITTKWLEFPTNSTFNQEQEQQQIQLSNSNSNKISKLKQQ